MNNSGKAIRFHESKVRAMGRGASGVRGIMLGGNEDKVVGMICVNNLESHVLVVSENGYGKRSDLDSYRITNMADPRAGQGQDAATKAYVDASVSGLDVKESVRVATTSNIILSGTQTIDSINVLENNRVLVKNQTSNVLKSNDKIKNYTNAEKDINAVLQEYITPLVESDGGYISLKSFQDGVVTVSLKGACSGCPSSTITLKNGIESLLKEKIGDIIKKVVASQD